jgi:hypothetical protein
MMQTTKQEAAPDYIANWLHYLSQMTPAQLARWKSIIRSRVSLTVLAEAVDLVMRETARAQQQPSGHAAT